MKSVLTLCCTALALAACETTAETRLDSTTNVGEAVQQPLRDLSLVREVIPPVLVRAAEAPYALQNNADCAWLAAEITELNAVLGPDLDRTAREEDYDREAIAAELVGGAVGLPFGGVVRRLTGAAERQRETRVAVLSGIARRSYLKGVARAQNCIRP